MLRKKDHISKDIVPAPFTQFFFVVFLQYQNKIILKNIPNLFLLTTIKPVLTFEKMCGSFKIFWSSYTIKSDLTVKMFLTVLNLWQYFFKFHNNCNCQNIFDSYKTVKADICSFDSYIYFNIYNHLFSYKFSRYNRLGKLLRAVKLQK